MAHEPPLGSPSDPDARLNLKSAERYLRIDVTGTLRLPVALVLVKEIAAETARSRHDRVLIDLRRMRGVLTLEDLFDMGNDLADALAGLRQVAIVQHVRQSDFGAVVADQRGLNVKVFRDEGAAQAWLTSLP